MPTTAAARGVHETGQLQLDYEQHDAPQRVVRTELERVIVEAGLEAGLTRYPELKRYGPAEAFDETMLNTLGYALMGAGRRREAIAVFQLNVMLFPEAFNPYDSLGEAYMENRDLELAAAYYQKSVELNPGNTNAIRAIERLRSQLEARSATETPEWRLSKTLALTNAKLQPRSI